MCVFAEGNSLLDAADAFLFHQPYYKLVMKSFARILLNDFLSDPDPDYKGRYAGLEAFRCHIQTVARCYLIFFYFFFFFKQSCYEHLTSEKYIRSLCQWWWIFDIVLIMQEIIGHFSLRYFLKSNLTVSTKVCQCQCNIQRCNYS